MPCYASGATKRCTPASAPSCRPLILVNDTARRRNSGDTAVFKTPATSPLMGWSGRAPAPPAIEAGKGRPRQGARHVSETQLSDRRDRHRYRQELVPHRGPRSARRNRAAAEVVTRPGRSTARQPATVLNRYGGLRRRASSQSQAPNARPRRPTDAREIRAPLFEGTEE